MQNDPQSDPQQNDPRLNDPRYNNPNYSDADPNYGDPNYGDPNYGDPNYAESGYGGGSDEARTGQGGYRDPNFGEQYYANPPGSPAPDPRVEENWQLNDDRDEPLRWMQLEHNGEDIANQWRLESPSGGAPASEWQPVEYQSNYEVETSGRRNWVLPAFITVALLAVLGYIAFLGLNRFALGELALPSFGGDGDTQIAAPNEEDPAVVPLTDTTNITETTPITETGIDNPEPTATEPLAEPTDALDEPTPAPLPETVTVDAATVTIQYGLNARSEPRVDEATFLYQLDDGTRGYVLNQQDDGWTQMIIVTGENTGDTVWVSSEFLVVEPEEIDRETAEGLGLVEADTATTEDATDEATAEETGGEEVDGEEAADESTDDATTADEGTDAADEATLAETGITATVTAEAGLVNARSAPEITTDNIVDQIPSDSVLAAVARSEDGEWVQVQREDGSLVWIFAELVALSEPYESLPLPGQAPSAAAPEGDDTAAEVETGTDTTSTDELTATDEVTGTDEAAATDDVTTTDNITGEDGAGGDADEATAENGEIAVTPGEPVGDVEPEAPFTNVAPEGPAVIVASSTGVRAHAEPSLAADVVTSLPSGAVLPAIALSEDDDWIQVSLPDNRTGWALRRAVQTTPDIDSLSTGQGDAGEADADDSDTQDADADSSGPDAVAQNNAASSTADGITVTTNDRIGTNVYAEPVASNQPVTRLQPSTELTAIGRTAARDWVRVVLEDGTEGWVFVSPLDADAQAIQALPTVE